MLNTGNEAKVEGEGALSDRRLKCIERGDLNWIGKGFLAVIKNDCKTSKLSEIQKPKKTK